MWLLNRVIGVAEPSNWKKKNREGLGANCSGRELGLDTPEIPDLHFCPHFFFLFFIIREAILFLFFNNTII